LRLKKKLRDKWVKALRSGEYEQAIGRLEEAGGYCCLGVLCAVRYGRNFDHDEAVPFAYGTGADSEITEDAADILWRMNDRERLEFPEIADWIEANVPVTE
jgi:hypothetical protein